jgi:hypothetical protein
MLNFNQNWRNFYITPTAYYLSNLRHQLIGHFPIAKLLTAFPLDYCASILFNISTKIKWWLATEAKAVKRYADVLTKDEPARGRKRAGAVSRKTSGGISACRRPSNLLFIQFAHVFDYIVEGDTREQFVAFFGIIAAAALKLP